MRRLKNEKRCFYFIFCLLLFVSGCRTTGQIRTDDSDIIEGNSYAAGRLEATVKALDGTVSDSRERIADVIETSRGIADGVERIEYLFGKYEQEVERLLNEIDGIRSQAEIPGKNYTDSRIDTDTVSGGKDSAIGSKN